MRDYWGKQPLLIRGAFPDIATHVETVEQVLAWSTQSKNTKNALQTSSRLIQQNKAKHSNAPAEKSDWKLTSQPKTLPSRDTPNWTVLLQNLETLSPKATAVLNEFAFASYAELDDLMVSFATDSGGVGAHVDSYDVFLLQTLGQRRWRIEYDPARDAITQAQSLALRPDMPLKILQNFNPTHEWVLNPGDMLYLPPQIAHEGVAVGECMTYSIGFRAPTLQVVSEDLVDFLANKEEVEDGLDDENETDKHELSVEDLAMPPAQLRRPARAAIAPAAIEAQDIAVYRAQLNAYFTDAILEEHLGCVLTQAKRDLPAPARAPKLSLQKPLRLHPATRMLYSVNFVFVQGYSFAAAGEDAILLAQLADTRKLDAASVASLSEDAQTCVADWLGEGWVLQ